MNKKVQQRIVGLSVVTILAIIILPLVLPDGAPEPQHVPWKPLPRKPEATVAQPLPFDHASLQDKISKMEKQVESTDIAQQPRIDRLVVGASSVEVSTGTPSVTEPLVVKSTVPADPTRPAWVVQLATLSSEASAKKLVSRLNGKKIPAFYRHRNAGERSLWRVLAGPELKKSLLEPYQEQLLEEFPDLKIISYRPLG
ncbi:SPOR domain-containing protein [Pelagibaculum spongiae]|uniref:SPOR domain-containing protein n=1 Tax=Pelagibaculum spongiae TaxID=2080658 RepID=A0A2V1GY34_9GAMM|nr:SPOR domain-containing protein [Pelagibaculum spongiae]PVZ71686.1 hypothetical protein DC094_01260 [Pelagibaculum spongiae]